MSRSQLEAVGAGDVLRRDVRQVAAGLELDGDLPPRAVMNFARRTERASPYRFDVC